MQNLTYLSSILHFINTLKLFLILLLKIQKNKCLRHLNHGNLCLNNKFSSFFNFYYKDLTDWTVSMIPEQKRNETIGKKKVSSYWLFCLWLQMLLVKKEILMRIFWWNIFSKTPMSLVGCGCGFKEDSRQSSEIRLLADSQQFFFVVRVTNRMLNHSFWNEPNPAVDPLKLITLFINFDKLEPLRSSHH